MNTNASIKACVGALGLLLVSTVGVNAKCEDPNTDCQDKIGEAASDLKHSGSITDAIDNAKTVGSAMRDCVNCATESVTGQGASSNSDGGSADSGN